MKTGDLDILFVRRIIFPNLATIKYDRIMKYYSVKSLISPAVGLLAWATVAVAQETVAQDTVAEQTRVQSNVTVHKSAVVNLPVNFLRLEPDYESPLETQLLMGTEVEVLDRQGYWVKVRTPEPYEAWCTDLGLSFYSEKWMSDYRKTKKVIVTAVHSYIYDSNKENRLPVCPLVQGDIMRLIKNADSDGWMKVELPDATSGYIREENAVLLKEWAKKAKATPENLEQTALQYLGTPYMWGGASVNGFDCSGLIRHTYFMNGVLLPRNASQQIFCGEPVNTYETIAYPENEKELNQYWKKRISKLKKGDLLFFGRIEDGKKIVTHVGMYLENGKFIHASHLVRISSFNPGTGNMYENAHKLIGAGRIVNEKGKILLKKTWDESARAKGYKAQYVTDSPMYNSK